MEGELVVELYTVHSPRACSYFADLVTNSSIAQHLRFSERDRNRVLVTTSSSDASFAPGEHFFGDELAASSGDDDAAASTSLRFTGAGLIGVPMEPASLRACAFFVTLRPAMAELGADCVVVGRVVRGMSSVLGAVMRARTEATTTRSSNAAAAAASEKLVKPLEILRAARMFVDVTPPRPVVFAAEQPQQQQQQQNRTQAAAAVSSKKKLGSLLDSMFE